METGLNMDENALGKFSFGLLWFAVDCPIRITIKSISFLNLTSSSFFKFNSSLNKIPKVGPSKDNNLS